jgi:hypothetical protein
VGSGHACRGGCPCSPVVGVRGRSSPCSSCLDDIPNARPDALGPSSSAPRAPSRPDRPAAVGPGCRPRTRVEARAPRAFTRDCGAPELLGQAPAQLVGRCQVGTGCRLSPRASPPGTSRLRTVRTSVWGLEPHVGGMPCPEVLFPPSCGLVDVMWVSAAAGAASWGGLSGTGRTMSEDKIHCTSSSDLLYWMFGVSMFVIGWG